MPPKRKTSALDQDEAQKMKQNVKSMKLSEPEMSNEKIVSSVHEKSLSIMESPEAKYAEGIRDTAGVIDIVELVKDAEQTLELLNTVKQSFRSIFSPVLANLPSLKLCDQLNYLAGRGIRTNGRDYDSSRIYLSQKQFEILWDLLEDR